MEEDTLISLSATASSENTSPEELRWKDYQAKTGAGAQLSWSMRPSIVPNGFNGDASPSILPNAFNGHASPTNRQVSTANTADYSTPICNLWNNGASFCSAGFNSWSSGSIEGTPSTTASPAESPFPSLRPLPQASPFPGLQSQSQLGLQSQSPLGLFSAPGLSSGSTSISTVSHTLPAASCVQTQSEKACSLQWPEHSLQKPILSMPSLLVTIAPSPAAACEEKNILPWQRDPTTGPGENFDNIPAEMSFKISNTESGSSVQHGISSLPDAGCKYSHPKTISLLTSKQVFQKTVIRMQSRRHGGLKRDGPRVSFLGDYGI